MSPIHRARSWAARLAVFSMAVAILVAVPAVVSPPPPAEAAVGSNFNAGRIIDDAVFYDSQSLTASDIQSFLNSKVRNCASGRTCLKDYRQNTDNRPSDRYCDGYTARANESAAQIIDRVARSCGISQKVLLVLLEKEQSLVTDPAPRAGAFSAATGQGCPDGGVPCNPDTLGFFYQVYYAARQYEIYRLTPNSWGYQAGRWNNILYNPDRGCGSQRVFIENQATAALYIYTPYTPNAAALRNLYGSGDDCSAYGNRNFWRLYTDWFGSTYGYPVLGEMGARWRAIGGASSNLGSPVAPEVCDWTAGRQNCYQNFQNGAMSWTPSTGAWETYGAIRGRWEATGFERGPLGYPVGSPICALSGGGCYQNFQSGAITWTPSAGAWETYGAIRARWQATKFETGPLGYPVGAPVCGIADGGCYQNFQNGAITSTPSAGTWETHGPMRTRWATLKYEKGALGFPVGPPTCGIKDGGCYQDFQKGAITWSPAAGAWETHGAMRGRWQELSFERGVLGYPTGAPTCGIKDGGCYQNFQGGAITSQSSAGTWETHGAVRARWQSLQFETGQLGYPTAPPVTAGGRSAQTFQGGSITVDPSSGSQVLSGAVDGRWRATGGLTGTLGAATGPYICGTRNGGCYQNFAGGAVSHSPRTGTWETFGVIRDHWRAQGFEEGALGYPTAAPVVGKGRTTQTFEGGALSWSAGSGVVSVVGAVHARWNWTGGLVGPLRAPTGPYVCGTKDGGCYQNFEGGAVSFSPASGTWETHGELRARWKSLGYEDGVLGYPITPITCGTPGGGCYQDFQFGAISYTPSTGSWETYGPIRQYWRTQNFERGRLGYPTGPVTAVQGGGAEQRFQGGLVAVTPTGAVTVTP